MNHLALVWNRTALKLRGKTLLWRDRQARLIDGWMKAHNAGDEERAEKLWVKLNAVSSEEERSQYQELRDLLLNPEPSPWLAAMGQAHECEARFDWDGAKAAYERAAFAEPNAGLESGAWRDLSALHSMLDEDDLALECAARATEAARRCDSLSVLAMALGAEASLLLASNPALAREKIAEELAVLEDESLHDILRMRALILRARCAVQENDLDGAGRELDLVWTQIKKWRNEPFFAGRHGVLAAYWATRSGLSEKRGDWRRVQKARLEVVEHCRFVASVPQIEGPFKHNNLALALHRAGEALQRNNSARAAELFAQSRELRAFIGLGPLKEAS